MINTVIINPQKQDRRKISSFLEGEKSIKIVAEGKDGYDALRLISRYKPDIAILDAQLEFIEGGDIPPLLKTRSPSTAIVIVTAKISDHQLHRAASNEVAGFVHRETDMETLPGILKCIAGGGCFISPRLGARFLHILSSGGPEFQAKSAPQGASQGGAEFLPKADPVEYLSKMELRVLTFVGEGGTSDKIAERLGLAAGTVRNYISTLMRKTGLRNRTQLAIYAFFYGLVTFSPDFAASAWERSA